MRKTILTLCLLTFAFSAMAERITEQDAALVARHFMQAESVKNNQLQATKSPRTAMPQTALRRVALPEENQFYVYEYPTGGWVMISASDAVRPVIAFSETGSFLTDNMPDNVKYWQDVINEGIRTAEASPEQPSAEAKEEWQALRKGVKVATDAEVVVDALVSSQWNQTDPFNRLCPYKEGESRAFTGCVATVMAQIMNYWMHPVQGTGSHSYTSANYGTLSADFGNTTYDWGNMLDVYKTKQYVVYEDENVTYTRDTADCTEAEAIAVGTLMYHCGVAVDMEYSNEFPGSSASISAAKNAFTTYFGYKSSISSKTKSQYSSSDWISLIKGELDAKRPFLYTGSITGYAGHAFICDGYRSDNYFHFNFGWAGSHDGWYDLSSIITNPNDNNYNYSDNQAMIMGIEPNETSKFARLRYNLTNVSIESGQQSGLVEKGESFSTVFKSNSQWFGLTEQNAQVKVTINGESGKNYSTFADGLLTISIPAEKVEGRILIEVKTAPDFTIGNNAYCAYIEKDGQAYWDIQLNNFTVPLTGRASIYPQVHLTIPATTTRGINGTYHFTDATHIWNNGSGGWLHIDLDSVTGGNGTITLKYIDDIFDENRSKHWRYEQIQYCPVYHVTAEWTAENGNRYVIDNDLKLLLEDSLENRFKPINDISEAAEPVDSYYTKVTQLLDTWGLGFLLACEDAKIIFDGGAQYGGAEEKEAVIAVKFVDDNGVLTIPATTLTEDAELEVENSYGTHYYIGKSTGFGADSLSFEDGNVNIMKNIDDTLRYLVFDNTPGTYKFVYVSADERANYLPIQLYQKLGAIELEVNSAEAEYWSNFSTAGAYNWSLYLTHLIDADNYDCRLTLDFTSTKPDGISGYYSEDSNINLENSSLVRIKNGVKTTLKIQYITMILTYTGKDAEQRPVFDVFVSFICEDNHCYLIRQKLAVGAIDAVKGKEMKLTGDTGDTALPVITSEGVILQTTDIFGRNYGTQNDHLTQGVYIIQTDKGTFKRIVK